MIKYCTVILVLYIILTSQRFHPSTLIYFLLVCALSSALFRLRSNLPRFRIMDYKRHRFYTSNWKDEFRKWFPKQTVIGQKCVKKIPDSLDVKAMYIYVFQENSNFYLLGYAVETATIPVYNLFPWRDSTPILYGELKELRFSRCELWRCVWHRFKMCNDTEPVIFQGGENMETAYRKWERERYALWLCFRETNVNMSVLVHKEVQLVQRVSRDLFVETCNRLKISATKASFTEYLTTQYELDVSLTTHEPFDGLVTFLENSIRKKWSTV